MYVYKDLKTLHPGKIRTILRGNFIDWLIDRFHLIQMSWGQFFVHFFRGKFRGKFHKKFYHKNVGKNCNFPRKNMFKNRFPKKFLGKLIVIFLGKRCLKIVFPRNSWVNQRNLIFRGKTVWKIGPCNLSTYLNCQRMLGLVIATASRSRHSAFESCHGIRF
jgi:hypothetical protein